MNNTELRELDAWIAEHVMEYKRGHPGGCKTEYWQPPPYKFGVIPVEKLPQFTSNPADALAVLKKCLEKSVCEVVMTDNRGTTSIHEQWYGQDGIERENEVEAPTLELAICQFAQKLFSK